MTVKREALGTTSVTHKTGNVYKRANKNSGQMMKKSRSRQDENPKKNFSEIARSLAEKRKKHDITMVEQFIEDNSAEYKRKTIWSYFSNLMTYKEFNAIIDSLQKTGKIALDREGYIVWIWYPESEKEYRNSKNLVF
jgi:hypothetical protein